MLAGVRYFLKWILQLQFWSLLTFPGYLVELLTMYNLRQIQCLGNSKNFSSQYICFIILPAKIHNYMYHFHLINISKQGNHNQFYQWIVIKFVFVIKTSGISITCKIIGLERRGIIINQEIKRKSEGEAEKERHVNR